MAKQIFLLRGFAHRRNADASFDSICLACFLTVGNAAVDVALQDFESAHRCKPWGLDSYRSAPGLTLRSRLPKEII
jgi:hypothetical protein